MLRSKFKNRANKSKTKEDIKKYKKQRNKVTKLNKKLKKVFFRENEPRGNNVKNFGNIANLISPIKILVTKKILF